MNLVVGTKTTGSKFLALLLEPVNLALLKQGEPVITRIEDLFPDGVPPRLELAIYYSETPEADARAIDSALLPEVMLNERTRRQTEMRPHCPECKSTMEQMGMARGDAPVHTCFCAMCGCVLGVVDAVTKERGR